MKKQSAITETSGRQDNFDVLHFIGRWGTIISLGFLIVLFSSLRPDVFPTTRNLFNILNQVAILGIMAVGLTTALVMGQFDLSIAAIATLGGFLTTFWLVETGPSGLLPVLIGVLLLALLIGMFNGFAVSYMGINAFIVTLATGSVISGVVLGISKSQTVLSGIPDNFLVIGQSKVGPVPVPVIILLVVSLLLHVLLEHTEPGRHMYAIGGNIEAARLSGINVKRFALLALGISAVSAAIAGIVVSANLGVGRPQGVGDTYLLGAFAAAFIGASTLRPGKFHIVGTVVGVLLIGVINNGLSILGVETFWQLIVRGLLLLLAVFASGLVSLRQGH